MKECKLNILEPVLLAILITAIVSQLVAYGFFLILLSGGVAEGVVFAQHFRAARIPSPWCSMNILLNLRPGIGVESSLYSFPHHWV